MRKLGFLSAVLAMGVVFAQESAYSQTMDQQMQRMQPMQNAPAGTTTQLPPRYETIDSVGNGAIPALVTQVQTSNGISFITGGIGDEERDALKAQEGQFNTRLLFTAPEGDYISDVMLRIFSAGDASNPILAVDGTGPYFYTSLKPGTYIIELNPQNDSTIKRIKVAVPANGVLKEHVVFNEQ